MIQGIDDELCELPVFYVEDTDDVTHRVAVERFRLAITIFPVIVPLLAFLGYPATVDAFHNLLSLSRSWYSVDGGQAEAELITPILNGIVQPAAAITFATIVGGTLTSLRSRQVSIRTCLNKEACDIRQLVATVDVIFQHPEDTERRRAIKGQLRAYVSRLIVESRAGGGRRWYSLGADLAAISKTSESELDGIMQMMYRSASPSSLQPPGEPPTRLSDASLMYEPVRVAAPGLLQALNAQRSTRLAEIQTSYPAVHWAILILLGFSIFVNFLIESDQAALQFLDSLRLRLLFTILSGVGAAVAALCVDLNDPFRGNFRITPSADQLYILRAALEEPCVLGEPKD